MTYTAPAPIPVPFPLPQQRRAYSYLRLSSRRQLTGDGFRRQRELAQAYADKHGLILDELSHIGSGFTGANFVPGTALYEFVARVNSGGIPRNSVLILESLDRLSRNKVMSAFNVFNKIIETGIEIVTLLDGKTFSSKSLDDSFLNILEFLFGSARAREESKRKSERLSHTWEQKRRTDKVLTTRGPRWLRYEGPSPEYPSGWVPIPEKVRSVRRIFELAAAGVGCGKIARMLNNPPEGVEYPTLARSTAWHSGTVYPLISGEQVLGHYQPKKLEFYDDADGVRRSRAVAVGELRRNYYGDGIIPEALYNEANRKLAEKAMSTPSNPSGRRGSKHANLFTGLVYCAECGTRMTLQTGGPRQKPYLQCISQESGKCKTKAKPKYEVFEELILKAAADNRFAVEVNHADADKVRQRIEELSVEVTRDERGRDRLLASFITAIETDESIKSAIDGLRTRIEGNKKEIAQLKIELERMTSSDLNERRRTAFQRLADNTAACKTDDELYVLRARIRDMLAGVINGIYVFSDGYFVVSPMYGSLWQYQARHSPMLPCYFLNSGSACYLEYYPGAAQLVEPPWLEYDCKDYPRFMKWSSIDVARRGYDTEVIQWIKDSHIKDREVWIRTILSV